MTHTPFLRLALAAAATASLAACSLFSDPVEQAQEAFAAQDYFAARDHVLAALEADGEDVAALELFARIQLAMGLGAEAIATLDRLATANGLPEDGAVLRAEALLQTGEREAALELLEGEESAESWRLRALAAIMADDPQGAAEAFMAGRDAPGDQTKLYTAAATFHLDRGNADAARFAVARAQELAPQSIETLFVTARLAQMDGQAELAARAYMGILELSENDRPALLGAISQLDRLGRLDLVRPLVARGRAAYPTDIEFIYLDASVLAFDGNWQATRDLLQQNEAAVADHDNARGLYGQALLNLGQVELARAQVEPLVNRFPDNAAYARILTEIYLAAGDAAQALRVIQPFAARSNAEPVDRELAERASRG
ncbi:tetratricopeptide repeat protein [Erythrobacter sp. EC-HK427]|uniref:tetratricopeptide repeat protein n=1 Tax=Erythrobacter sp. EC-HK427 TaxID=2038396 RepID=UPI001258F6AC|nr:tetratricopeptide repeat protein [Erythrobacter sp. EC-HK427]VVT16862.1 conserved exported hypothetical protein [Erythrobacter sp. EC-HK427]